MQSYPGALSWRGQALRRRYRRAFFGDSFMIASAMFSGV